MPDSSFPTTSTPKFEVADVFRQFGPTYRNTYSLSFGQIRIMRDIEQCRTHVLGGHFLQCNGCDHKEISYNSCCNRHCPKCQSLNKARWLKARQAELLQVPYFHMVFILPHELNSLILRNKTLLLGLLFQTVNQTLQTFAKDPKYKMEGQLGYTAILHRLRAPLGIKR